ncbi:DNA mismatch repair endonuclease MutL, partial [Roseburia sp. MSJ-14]|uniref:DNA mismatch repair endonuclease MutL n=1 Tax=Roseburia sp. MSJ-14 TaxID=2841514 RepID=UPI001C125BDF
MGKINVLDKHVAELIAAGEVVERPSSVIKELVENSIDAGATVITVEIKNGGVTFMRVSDNGCGILKEDIRPAFIRHATSKVKEEDDLDAIATLGFRGEALASVASVSHLELITKAREEEIGTRYLIEGGEEVLFEDAGCPDGTTFIIRDLFYNVPARMKFLKTDMAEGNAVSNVIDKIALSHPEIALTYIKDSKNVLRTAGDGKLLLSLIHI